MPDRDLRARLPQIELADLARPIDPALKCVFEKTGVRRRALVGKVFFAHHEPRARDNERRVINGQPVRGGPIEGGA